MIRYPIEIGREIGIIPGSKTCVFIKLERGTTIYGTAGKNINLANEIFVEYGYTVCVCASPQEGESPLKKNIVQLTRTLPQIDRIIFIGNDHGALVGAQQAYECELITDMLLINGPIMVNWYKTKTGIEKFTGGEVMLVYGEEDPSYKCFDLLNTIKSSKVSKFSVPNADHGFTGLEDKLDELIAYFIKKKYITGATA